MANRVVTAVAKDSKGRIVAIGNPGEPWSPITTSEAIVQISTALHDYVVTAHGKTARVGVVSSGGEHFLRTIGDTTSKNNLDDLPLLDTVNPHTGGFDVLIDVEEAVVAAAVKAAYAADVLPHSATYAFDGSLIVINVDLPDVQPVFGVSASDSQVSEADCAGTLRCWVRSLDDLTDSGWAATVKVRDHVRLALRAPSQPGVPWRLELTYRPLTQGDLSVIGASAERQAFLSKAIAEYLKRTRPDVFPIVIDRAAGSPTNLGLRFVRRGSNNRVQVGASFSPLSSEGFPAPLSAGSWNVAVSRAYLAQRLYKALAIQLGAAPPPSGLAPVSLGDGVWIDVLEVSLDDAGLVLSGRLHKDNPTVTATFSMSAAMALSANQTLQISPGTPTVTVDEWYAKIGDFFSGGAITRAIEQGIHDALASQGQHQLVGFLSTSLLDDLLTFGKSVSTKLTSRAENLVVDRHAVTISGTLRTPALPKPVVGLRAFVGEDGQAVLDAGSSWAPAGSITSVKWRFGDGESIELEGNDVALLIGHQYSAAGAVSARVDVTDGDGRTSSESFNLSV